MSESVLNAISVNERTGDIVIACGATGYFKIEISTDGSFNTDTDVGVFAVARKRQQTFTTLLRRHYPIIFEEEGRYAVATSGSLSDLTQPSGDVIILYGGTATTVI